MLLTVRKFVNEFLRVKESLYSAKSSLGGQLERLRQGTVNTRKRSMAEEMVDGQEIRCKASADEYGQYASAEDRYFRYAIQLKIWETLSEEEQRVLTWQQIPKLRSEYDDRDTESYTRVVHESDLKDLKVPLHDLGGICQAPTKSGGRCKNKRTAGEARCRTHINTATAPHTRVTHSGEEYVCAANQEGEVTINGKLTSVEHKDGYVLVKGLRAVNRSHDDIARITRLTARQVRSRISSAYEKIATHKMLNLLGYE